MPTVSDTLKLLSKACLVSLCSGFLFTNLIGQLWLEKLGAKEPFSGNAAICRTIAREEEALGRCKLITGYIVLLPMFQVHGKKSLEDDWLAASPDGLVDKCSGWNSRGVLEIKRPSFKGEMSRASPWKRIPL
ncbi:hypothetical protein SADUNF_Sadunf08G0028800 [Salix dunnii]|uniref:YqaJ viral recombinase domain-containing protein n=1 Tax=Salix dunnii TaxID=1413687 RepID=A0A835MX47_9ROSI|nr:hypothetical protein SADUNF_Sadunf08G0028800 [Salix dunnii]